MSMKSTTDSYHFHCVTTHPPSLLCLHGIGSAALAGDELGEQGVAKLGDGAGFALVGCLWRPVADVRSLPPITAKSVAARG